MTSRRRSTCRRTAVGLLRRVLKPWGGTCRRTVVLPWRGGSCCRSVSGILLVGGTRRRTVVFPWRGGSCCRSVSGILPVEKSQGTEFEFGIGIRRVTYN